MNAAAGQEQPAGARPPADPPEGPARHRRPRGRLAERVGELIAGFAGYVAGFEASQAFPGLSLYFHLRAIERRRGRIRAANTGEIGGNTEAAGSLTSLGG
jgi:hypothetical protein